MMEEWEQRRFHGTFEPGAERMKKSCYCYLGNRTTEGLSCGVLAVLDNRRLTRDELRALNLLIRDAGVVPVLRAVAAIVYMEHASFDAGKEFRAELVDLANRLATDRRGLPEA